MTTLSWNITSTHTEKMHERYATDLQGHGRWSVYITWTGRGSLGWIEQKISLRHEITLRVWQRLFAWLTFCSWIIQRIQNTVLKALIVCNITSFFVYGFLFRLNPFHPACP